MSEQIEHVGKDGRSHFRVTGGNCACGWTIINDFEWRLHLQRECEAARGGGEWTALREALRRHSFYYGDRYFVKCFCGWVNDAPIGYANGWESWAEHFLEALAAAAPAPPADGGFITTPANNSDVALYLRDAPPPQDGQGAELLGPPRGGISSDLAGPSNPGAVARQAREYYKTLLNNANMCAAAWLIHEAPIVTEVPSKAEREVATATDGPSERKVGNRFVIRNNDLVKIATGEAIPEWEPLFLFRARGYLALPALLRLREAYVQDGCTEYLMALMDETIEAFRRFQVEHPEWMKQPGVTQGKVFTPPSLPEAVAGNASAPVGEKRQPSGVGEPRTLADLADEIVEAMPYGKMSDANIREAILPVLKKALSTLSPNEGASSPADARTELVQKEVGEGLREGDEVLLRAKIYHIRVAGTNPRCARGFKLMVKDGDEEHVLFVTAAALAPAPKPAPPAEPEEKW